MNNNTIKVATWNISEGFSSFWDLNDGLKEGSNYQETKLIKQIVENINSYDLDVVCFQEFPVEIDGQEILKEYIFNNTKLKFCTMHPTSTSFLFKGGKVGVAIFSKYNIVEEEKTFFQNPNLTKLSKIGELYKTFDKGIILTKINYQNKYINIVNGHAIAFTRFDKHAEDFPQSYKPLSDLILKISNKDEPLIVCGDFNTEFLFDLIPEIRDVVIDIVDGTTTPPVMEGETHKKERKLDYILINNKFKKHKTLKTENLSDHYLCIAILLDF